MFENVREIILKVTRDCNLRCKYCYVRDKERFRGERMSFPVFKQIIERYITDREKSLSGKQQELRLIFHGGEPTLLDIKEFVRFLNYAKRRIPYIRFGMQTNLTNISAELAIILQQYEISPGISIDGWGPRLNRLRLGKKSAGLAKNVRLLNQYRVNCGTLMVLTKENIRRAKHNIDNILKNFPAQKTIKANYVENIYTPEPAYPEVTAEELFKNLFLPLLKDFLKKGRLAEANLWSILTRFFQTALFGASNDPDKDQVLGHCNVKFCAGGNKIAETDAEGTVCFCGRWDDTHEICRLGSVRDADLWGLNSYYKSFVLQKTKAAYVRRLHCDACPAGTICDYGCLAFAYAKYRRLRIREDLVCAYYLKIAAYLQKNAAVLLQVYARSQNWTLQKEKEFFLLQLPPGYPEFNSDTIAAFPGWSVPDTAEQNLLKVKLC